MAEALKNQFGEEIPRKIAGMIFAVHSEFAAEDFIRESLDGYKKLDLMPRGWRIAEAMRTFLPQDYSRAAEIIIASLGAKLEKTENNGMAPFLYMPHVFFVAKYGLDHFDISMRAQYELTQRFSAEFSIRPYLERYQDDTLAQLRKWSKDPNEHVRRLVSEGTRPRLPWAPRLREFQKNPRPVLELLDGLKDDPSLYVRRSVANNLNDIGKDHPELLFATARQWMKDAPKEREWLVRHALRSAVKRGESGALDVLGFGKKAKVKIGKMKISPQCAKIGSSVTIAFDVKNADSKPQDILIDLGVHYMKSNGKANMKVFKLKKIRLSPQESVTLNKTISLKNRTTRRHYPGTHEIEAILNGHSKPLGSFEVI